MLPYLDSQLFLIYTHSNPRVERGPAAWGVWQRGALRGPLNAMAKSCETFQESCTPSALDVSRPGYSMIEKKSGSYSIRCWHEHDTLSAWKPDTHGYFRIRWVRIDLYHDLCTPHLTQCLVTSFHTPVFSTTINPIVHLRLPATLYPPFGPL